MTPQTLAHHRLVRQHIVTSTCRTPGEVVSNLVAMQAQDYTSALWAVGLRVPGATEVDIQQAVRDRLIVRTWPMRGTLHFAAAKDVRWMLKLLTPRIVAGAAGRRRQLELDDATFIRCEKVFSRALEGGRQLIREEMFEALRRARIMVDNHRGYHILWRLAQEGLLCFGSHQGKQATFTLLDEWVPPAKSVEREKALAELARRYFIGHGPATLHDFVWWSGLKISEAREAIDLASPHLLQETVKDKVYWMSPGKLTLSKEVSSMYLLPGFDEFLLGYQDRSACLDPKYANKIVPGSNGIFLPTIVSNGRVIGTWKRATKKKSVLLTSASFKPMSKAESSAFIRAAEHYGKFMGLSVEI